MFSGFAFSEAALSSSGNSFESAVDGSATASMVVSSTASGTTIVSLAASTAISFVVAADGITVKSGSVTAGIAFAAFSASIAIKVAAGYALCTFIGTGGGNGVLIADAIRSMTVSATASGIAVALPLVNPAAVSIAATANGFAEVIDSASANVVFSQLANFLVVRNGQASTATTFTTSASGQCVVQSSASSQIAFQSTANALKIAFASAQLQLNIFSDASGFNFSNNANVGIVYFQATATPLISQIGNASGNVVVSAQSVAYGIRFASAASNIAFSAQASSRISVKSSAVGSVFITATAVGSRIVTSQSVAASLSFVGYASAFTKAVAQATSNITVSGSSESLRLAQGLAVKQLLLNSTVDATRITFSGASGSVTFTASVVSVTGIIYGSASSSIRLISLTNGVRVTFGIVVGEIKTNFYASGYALRYPGGALGVVYFNAISTGLVKKTSSVVSSVSFTALADSSRIAISSANSAVGFAGFGDYIFIISEKANQSVRISSAATSLLYMVSGQVVGRLKVTAYTLGRVVKKGTASGLLRISATGIYKGTGKFARLVVWDVPRHILTIKDES